MALEKVIAMQFSFHAPWSHHNDGGSECPAPLLLFHRRLSKVRPTCRKPMVEHGIRMAGCGVNCELLV